MTPTVPFLRHRRSTRVPLHVSIEVEGETGTLPFKGVTSMVNLHGALIRTAKPLKPGAQIYVRVLNAGESGARVVHEVADNENTYGIELDKPRNIWGVSPVPPDWEADTVPPSIPQIRRSDSPTCSN